MKDNKYISFISINKKSFKINLYNYVKILLPSFYGFLQPPKNIYFILQIYVSHSKNDKSTLISLSHLKLTKWNPKSNQKQNHRP